MSDIRLLEIPKWGLSMEEGTVLEWLIDVGDDFSEGQEICEIESSKIVNVLEAPYSGTLRKIIAGPGDTLPVQAPIAIAAPVDVPDAEIEAFAATLVVADAAAICEPAATAAADSAAASAPTTVDARRDRPGSLQALPASTVVDVPLSLTDGDDDSKVHATPRARALAVEHNINLYQIQGTGRNGRISVADIRQTVAVLGGHLPGPARFVTESVAPSISTADDSTVRATPVARRVAKAWGINLNDCSPSGRNSRVVRADVEAAQIKLHGPPATQQQSGSAGIEPLPDTPYAYEDSQLSGMRKTIASRLANSKQTAPHYRLTIDCRIDSLLELRRQINSDNPGARVSVNDFFVKAAAMALVDVPDCNIQFNGETVRKFEDAHIAVAVALESGLITPIVQSANKKGLVEISNETTSLVTRAKANTLKAEDFQGGTFTVSNLGMFGIRNFDAIINPPQAAILAIGAGTPRVIVDEGQQAIATLVTVTLSSDHRVIDGALGARWLAAFREFVEHPARLLS